MFMKTVSIYLVSISFLLSVNISEAVEPLSTAELASHCSHYKKDPSGVDAVFCIRYIQGFIDGAIATDERVAINAITKSDKKETFIERAMRTRKAGSKNADPTYYAEFCLGSPVPLKKVVEKIIKRFDERKHNAKAVPARETVYFILREEYPCEKK